MKKRPILLIFILVVVLALAKIFLSAKLATTGAALAQIESQTQELGQKNLLLEEQMLDLSSLSRISSEAARLGLRKTDKILSLTLEVPIALREAH